MVQRRIARTERHFDIYQWDTRPSSIICAASLSLSVIRVLASSQ